MNNDNALIERFSSLIIACSNVFLCCAKLFWLYLLFNAPVVEKSENILKIENVQRKEYEK